MAGLFSGNRVLKEPVSQEGGPHLARRLFFGLDFGRLLDDALAAIEAIRGDAVTQVRLTRLRVD